MTDCRINVIQGDSVSARRRRHVQQQQQRASVQHRTSDLVAGCRRHPFPSPGWCWRAVRETRHEQMSARRAGRAAIAKCQASARTISRGAGIIGSSRRRQPRRGRATVARRTERGKAVALRSSTRTWNLLGSTRCEWAWAKRLAWGPEPGSYTFVLRLD